MLASIQLENYYLSKIDYTYSENTDDEEGLKIGFNHEINYLDDQKLEVIINSFISDSGLELEVSLNGYFRVKIDSEDGTDDDPEIIKELCEKNTLSILFPYLRSAVSDISLKANIRPIILPTINIVKLIEDQKEKQQIEN